MVSINYVWTIIQNELSTMPDRIFNLLTSSCFSQARGQWLIQSRLSISSANPRNICSQSLALTWKWLFSVKVPGQDGAFTCMIG